VGETEVADKQAVITEVEGSAYPMGESRFVLREDDPLPSGFMLR
jgi:proline racemase